MDLYNVKNEVVATVIFDTEDIPKVKYTKWKYSHGYAMYTPKYKGGSKHFSRVIMDTNQFVDHINHNTLDNRKCNLRIVNKSQNQMNSNHKGISNLPHGKFYAHIKIHGIMLNLGHYTDEEEALWARWYAEIILFGEYRYPKEEPQILDRRKKEIMEYVDKKVQRIQLSA